MVPRMNRPMHMTKDNGFGTEPLSTQAIESVVLANRSERVF